MSISRSSWRIFPVAVLVFFAGVVAVRGQDEWEKRFEIEPFAGYRGLGQLEQSKTGISFDIDGDLAYGLMLRYTLPDYDPDHVSQVELMWSRQDTSVDIGELHGPSGSLDLSIDYLQIGGRYIWNRLHGDMSADPYEDSRLQPYVSGGLGLIYVDPDGGDSDARFSINVGCGAKYHFTKTIALDASIRGYFSFVNGDSTFLFAPPIYAIGYDGSILSQIEGDLGLVIAF